VRDDERAQSRALLSIALCCGIIGCRPGISDPDIVNRNAENVKIYSKNGHSSGQIFNPNALRSAPMNEGRNLAESMVRMYGLAKALALADRYAADCTASGDTSGHARWAAAALVIGERLEMTARFGAK
jgi:hypothetical protein